MQIKLPLVLDGSTGTQLQKRGFNGETTAEEWSLAHPEAVEDFQRRYIDAGSDVIYTPTFGANSATLESHKVFSRVRELNLGLAAISKRTAGDRAYVAGDISPCGRYLYPMGDATFEDLFDIYREQAAALEEAGVDLFVIETMVSVAEARAAILAVKSVSAKPVFVTFTCDENGKTMMGSDVTAALLICQGMGIDAFGLNCSVGPEAMLKQLKRLAEFAEIPLIAKPNAGLPEIVDGNTVYNCTPEEFTAFVSEMGKLGVCMFGGCCGTDVEHIEALARKVREITPVMPTEKNRDKLPCATGRHPALLPLDVQVRTVIECGDDLEEALEEAAESDDALICIEINSLDDVQCFADVEYAVDKALCIKCDDADLLEKTLRVYQGRALYEGRLSEKVLLPLVNKYGLII